MLFYGLHWPCQVLGLPLAVNAQDLALGHVRRGAAKADHSRRCDVKAFHRKRLAPVAWRSFATGNLRVFPGYSCYAVRIVMAKRTEDERGASCRPSLVDGVGVRIYHSLCNPPGSLGRRRC
jgi:hypothetical protein